MSEKGILAARRQPHGKSVVWRACHIKQVSGVEGECAEYGLPYQTSVWMARLGDFDSCAVWQRTLSDQAAFNAQLALNRTCKRVNNKNRLLG